MTVTITTTYLGQNRYRIHVRHDGGVETFSAFDYNVVEKRNALCEAWSESGNTVEASAIPRATDMRYSKTF